MFIVHSDPDTGRFDLDHPTVLRQGRDGLPGTAEAGDLFGTKILVVDAGGRDPWLAVSALTEDVHGKVDAGAVTGIPLGTDVSRAKVFYQGGLLPGGAESGDWFGSSLAQFGDGLLAGAAFEDVGPITDAGGVTSFDLYGRVPPRAYRQGRGVPGPPEAGDHFGETMVGLGHEGAVIGAPLEDIGEIRNAGTIIEFAAPGSHITKTAVWYQGYRGLEGTAQEDEWFGRALAYGPTGLVVGAPWGNISAINFLPFVPGSHRPFSVTHDREIDFDTPGVPGNASGFFGWPLGISGRRVLIGVPSSTVNGMRGAGRLIDIGFDSHSNIVGPPARSVTQASFGSHPEFDDRFGNALSQH